MLLIQRQQSGKYINTRFTRCQSPSFSTIVPANSGLSDMLNNAKVAREHTKHIIEKIPSDWFSFLNERMAKRSGTNRNSINPITEPTPCIIDGIVTSSLVALTFYFTQ